MSHKASCSTTHNSHGEASFNPKMYDVFLSFRGKDTRTGFVRDLSGALKTARVHTFIDSKTLRKGDVIGHTLKEAIKNSRICIPVFSKNFAESKWCLEEVSHMLKSENGRICPLFYDVTPSDVRHPDEGMFAKAFIDHSNGGKINKDSITQWKRDLENVSSRSGWSLDQVSGDEKQLIWLVLADVKKELGKVELDIDPKRCIGLETPIREVVELLNLRSERVNAEKPVRTVGIDGMGGVGKTTLAKAVYKKIYSQFKKACLVLDVREKAQKDGLCKLQKQILKDLTVVKHEVKHVEHGKSLINDRLRATKLLLVLDNVDGFSADQLEELLGKRNFGAGSQVLVTTRNRHVLNLAHVAHECIYHGITKTRYLSYESNPKKRYLKTENFAAVPDLELFWLSGADIRETFCDTAPFWNLRWLRWRNCTLKCLPAGLNLKRLVILDLAGSQIKQLWNEQSNLKKPKKLQVLNLSGCTSLERLPDFSNCLTSLTTLDLDGCDNLQMIHESISHIQQLKNLNLRNCNALRRLPASIGAIKCLSFLNLEGCAVSTLPEEFGQLVGLEVLDLSRCKHLRRLPDSFGNLVQLKRLEMHHNHKLTDLPPSFGGLGSLMYLNAGHCNLTENGLPPGIWELSSLQILHLEHNKFRSIPASISKLYKLSELYLDGCKELSELPFFPESLERCYARDCTLLSTFCSMEAVSKRLMILDLRMSWQLAELPGLGSLQALTAVNLLGCKSISTTAIESLRALMSLDYLFIGGPGVPVLDFYELLKDMSFNECFISDHSTSSKWRVAEVGGKNAEEMECIDDAGMDNTYCAGYIVVCVSQGDAYPKNEDIKKENNCSDELGIMNQDDDNKYDCTCLDPTNRLWYTIERSSMRPPCAHHHPRVNVYGGNGYFCIWGGGGNKGRYPKVGGGGNNGRHSIVPF
eukprot:Gb_00923 [translate_table: standard]